MNCPRTRFLRTSGEVRLQPEGVEANAGELVEAALLLAGGGEELCGVLRGEVDELRLELGVEEDRVGWGDEGCQRCESRGIPQDRLIDVEHIDERLGRHQPELLDEREVGGG